MSMVECGLKNALNPDKSPFSVYLALPIGGWKKKKRGQPDMRENCSLKKFSLNLLVKQVSSYLYSSKTEVYRTVNSATKVKHLMRSNSEDPVLCSNFACKNAVVFYHQKSSPCGQDANPNAPSIKMRESP